MNLPSSFSPTRMNLHKLCFCIIFFLSAATFVTSLPPFHPPDNIAINCGFSGNRTAPDGREWIGDSGSVYFVSRAPNSKSISTSAPVEQSSSHFHGIPFTSARISQTQFTYAFPVSPGPKFVRLHFYPASYRALPRSSAFFTVKANHFTLLHNFSASLTADSLGITTVSKEFCINVKSTDQPLTITFSPSRTSPSDQVYAFVNAIEVVSMPDGLYYPMNKKNQEMGSISFWGNTALETVHRVNIGGSYISSAEDTGMFREWFEDTTSFIHHDLRISPLATTIRIKYGKVPNYVAPQKVYQTSWSVDLDKNDMVQESTINFTWKLPIDQGFRYLIRLHFCELDYGIQEYGARPFFVYVNNQMIEPHGDIIKWSGDIGAGTYKDYIYVVHGDKMDGKRNMLISLRPIVSDIHHNNGPSPVSDVILKGLEIFKLSNLDNNLAVANPLVVYPSLALPTARLKKSLYISAGGNKIATVVYLVLVMLNGVVSYLHNLYCFKREDLEHITYPLIYEGSCRVFSLAEVRSATENFNEKLVIGRGGSGEVYRGCIDRGTEKVAMKRLHSKSKQGAREFWAEIEMLSKLRNNNLVTLIGYCNQESEFIFVYEYMASGTLADHLYKMNKQGIAAYGRKPRLSWEQRLKICLDAAQGLEFLHNCNEGRGIIHRDVKSTNILLDENLRAKIADFGLSKMVSTTHPEGSTSVKGTCGYLDPDYLSTNRPTKKSDVYAFGVVLWEVLCGRPAIGPDVEGEERSLAKWVQYCFGKEMIEQIIEPGLREQMSETSLKTFTDVALRCLNNDSNERPSIEEVVTALEHALIYQKFLQRLSHFLDAGAGCLNSDSNEHHALEDVLRGLEFVMRGIAIERSEEECLCIHEIIRRWWIVKRFKAMERIIFSSLIKN